MKKFLALLVAFTMVFGMSITASAATWEAVDNYEKLSTAFTDTDAEVHIILSGDIANSDLEELTANQGQKYTIDGSEHVISNLILNGAGDVVVNADINGDDEEKGMRTYGKVSVTVNGDIQAKSDGIDANEESKVVVNGTVRSEYEDAIDADDKANVTVNGNVFGGTGADGVDAADNTIVTVNGDVYGGDGQAPDADGNLYHKTINDPDGYSDGGAGVEASENAQVIVNGNTYGGDSYGTHSFSGAGIDATGYSKVVVSGNSTGGNQIANPEVTPIDITDGDGSTYRSYGVAGDGIYADSTTDITVLGDAIGGNSTGQESLGGCGVFIELIHKVTTSEDPETGEPVTENMVPGQITVKGKAIAGTTTGKNSTNSPAVYFSTYDDDPAEAYTVPVVTVGELVTVNDYPKVESSIEESDSYFEDNYVVVTGIKDNTQTNEPESDNQEQTGNTDSDSTESPKTSDTMHMAHIHMLLVAAAMMLLTISVVFKRNHYIK